MPPSCSAQVTRLMPILSAKRTESRSLGAPQAKPPVPVEASGGLLGQIRT